MTICTVFLAISPIFDPYLLASLGSFSLKFLDLPMLIVAALLVFAVGLRFSNQGKHSIFIIILLFAFFTMVSFLSGDENRSFSNALMNIAIEIVFAISVTLMWQSSSRELFVRIVSKVAFWATIFLFIQYIAVNLGFTQIFNGKIPFLNMGKHDYWAALIDPNTGDIRVHSIFQEPAYYGMYVLPVFASTLKNREHKKSVFYLLGLVLSSSLVAILGAVIVFVASLFFVRENASVSKTIKNVVLVAIAAGLLTLLYTQVDFVRETIDYALERTQSISGDLEDENLGSNKIRLLGYIDRFAEYPLFFKVFGVGSNQFSAYLGVTAYSNTIVSTILNYGIVGSVILLVCVFRWFKRVPANRIFLVVFVLVMASDYQWMNWYFFYLISWIVLSESYINAAVKLRARKRS